MAVRKELDGIDIGFVAGECLDGLPGADIPQLGESIAGPRNKSVLIGGVQADAHDVAQVVGKFDHFGARLDVPLHACHVARGRQDAPVIDEATAGKVSGVPRKLTSDPSWPIAVLVQIVDAANIIETAASNIIAARGVSTRHDPR